ncbi:hypothetical protein GCM10023195_73950 [Actinoallomurus liliacearum]|uniref:Major facilitator superfamily (MFS) profile domain-containing protein n=1 Tax=Actinoallomurus liliacearum TaxID=1080073 RepID=A0ABP8TYB5_9ACTN
MRNEAGTWLVPVPVAANAAGGTIAGLIVDRLGGAPWSFLFAAAFVAAATVVAAWPAGPITRADAAVTAQALTTARDTADPPASIPAGGRFSFAALVMRPRTARPPVREAAHG